MPELLRDVIFVMSEGGDFTGFTSLTASDLDALISPNTRARSFLRRHMLRLESAVSHVCDALTHASDEHLWRGRGAVP